MPDRCFFFGCWNEAGHYLWAPRAGNGPRDLEYYGNRVHLDGTLAPRRDRRTGELCWSGNGITVDERRRIEFSSDEYPQGQFLRHELSNGFTAIQWWDRCQGDRRGACNSTILLEGKRTSDEMLAALKEHFPHVLANLEKAGVQLEEVFPDG